MSFPPDLSFAVFERVFPRTLLALTSAEKASLARELAPAARLGELHRFPAALATRKWDSGRGYAPDLATLEHGLRLAQLSPEIEESGFERIATATEPDWYSARLRFDPGHRLLESDWPLEAVYSRPGEGCARQPCTILIWSGLSPATSSYKGAGRARFRSLSPNEEALLRPLLLGVPLGLILDRKSGPDFNSQILQRWIETGFLRAIDWAAVQNFAIAESAISS